MYAPASLASALVLYHLIRGVLESSTSCPCHITSYVATKSIIRRCVSSVMCSCALFRSFNRSRNPLFIFVKIMQGSGLNLKDHVVKTVAYYVKRSLEPQLAELAAYRELAMRASSYSNVVSLRVCEGCQMPHDAIVVTADKNQCGQCSKIVKCDRCESKPSSCACCSTNLCKRHAKRMMMVVQCCHRSVCKSCIVSCSGCAVDICQDCICCIDNDILEYCEGCCNHE